MSNGALPNGTAYRQEAQEITHSKCTASMHYQNGVRIVGEHLNNMAGWLNCRNNTLDNEMPKSQDTLQIRDRMCVPQRRTVSPPCITLLGTKFCEIFA